MRRIDRRSFLGGAVLGAGALALGRTPWDVAAQGRVPVARGGTFAQGVASGQQTPDGITLWTKVGELERTSRLQVEISPDEDFRRIVYRQDVVADARDAFAVHHRAEGRPFRPGEELFYRFYTCDQSSAVGRFRTALPADSREPVRIGFFSCQAWESGFYTAHAGLAAEPDLDLVVCLGDYVYEYTTETGDAKVRPDRTGFNGDGDSETLAEWRDKYALYHSDARLREVRRQFPLAAIWDDHEVENDYAGDVEGSGPRGERRVPFAERKVNGYRAFFEHMPRLRTPGAPDRIYGSMRLGANVEVLLLDQRQHRGDQPCAGNEDGQPCPEASDPSRTMLGAEQKAWLKDALAASGATWKVVGNQVMIMALDLPSGNPLNMDQWDGYPAERAEILRHVGDRGIDGVTFVTGDVHPFFAGDVAPDGRARPGLSPSVATEFVGGAITSKGIADEIAGEEAKEAIGVPADATIEANNPHIKLSNQAFKGYGVLEARPDELLVTFRGVRTTQVENSETFDLARFRVARGAPEVEVVSRADRPGV